MRRIASLSIVIIALFVVVALARLCVEKVPLGYVGIRSDLLGTGIEERDLPPGYHIVIPGKHRLQLIDARQKMMEWSGAERNEGFQLTATDQVTLRMDVTLIYSLEPGMGHLAIRKYGAGSGFEKQMRRLATKVIAEVLPQQQSQDFYDAQKRMDQAKKALDELNRMMKREGSREYMVAQDLLIRNLVFDQSFEKRLLEKQLLDQKQLLHEAATRREAALEVTQTIEKKTMAKVMAIQEQKTQEIQLLQAQTDAEIAKIEADAQFYSETELSKAAQHKREKIAQGELAKTSARARGDRATGAAYAGPGGVLLLVRKMVENVQFGDISINTNRTNPFDASEMLNMLGAPLSSTNAVQENAARAASVMRELEAYQFETTSEPETRPSMAASMPAVQD